MWEPFSRLASSDAFEALCYDVLRAEGFRDVNWRGPGPDGGRDIEAQWHLLDPTGGTFVTRWYVESKWYTDSVPFSDIEPKLLAAVAARADYLLLITSSRVRNTALNSVETWLRTRGDPLRFRYWTGRDLLRRVVRHEEVFLKHFPKLEVPIWADRMREIARLRRVAETGGERLMRRIVPSLQLCERMLEPGKTTQDSFVAGQLRLVTAEISLARFLDPDAQVAPSVRRVDVTAAVEEALGCVERGASAALAASLEPGVVAVTSYPTLLAVVYELILNAAQYSSDGHVEVSLSRHELRWRLVVSNPSEETLPGPWPSVGCRGSIGRESNVDGQGLGCWLSREALSVVGHRVLWTVEGQKWTVTVEGEVEE